MGIRGKTKKKLYAATIYYESEFGELTLKDLGDVFQGVRISSVEHLGGVNNNGQVCEVQGEEDKR